MASGKQHGLLLSVAGMVVAIGLVGCGREQTAPPAAKPPAVTVAQPESRQITDYDEFTGRVAAVETVEIRPRVSGYLEKISFTDGQIVKKGDVLFTIDQRPYQIDLERAQAQLTKDQAALKLAETDLQRIAKLREGNATSQFELDQAQSTRDQAQGSLETAQAAIDNAKLNLDYSVIKAPIDGKMSRPMITVGNVVNAGSSGNNLLTTIVSIDPIYVYFDVDENALLKYQAIMRKQGGAAGSSREAKIPVLVGLSGEDGTPHQGYMDFAENQVNAGTGTISVRGVLDNKDRRFTPGLFARVNVRVSDPHEVLLVPDRAIATDQGRKYVLVVGQKNTVEYRPVELGIDLKGMRVVKSGLTKDDRVVVDGLLRARPGATVEPQEARTPAAATTTPAQAAATSH
jgi:membrane fusion protein, multidrug efflux system